MKGRFFWPHSVTVTPTTTAPVKMSSPLAMRVTAALASRTTFFCICAVCSLLIFWSVPVRSGSGANVLLNHLPSFSSSASAQDAQSEEIPKDQHPFNDTLGFERIFVLNLPERDDKRDALSLAASLTNISVEYMEGIKGDTIVDKALPSGQENRKIPETMLGSWRAHMNAIRYIVEARISSALIMEDDTDWDIRIKSQLSEFSRGSRWLQSTYTDNNQEDTHSPYGDDWDVLWLGQCAPSQSENRKQAYIIPDDPAVARKAVFPVTTMNKGTPEWIDQYPDHSRIIHMTRWPICTFAYALSYRGAQKILYGLSVKRLTGTFDNALADWCGDKFLGADEEKDKSRNCIAAFPPYFHQHRVAGPAGKNSDNMAKAPESLKATTFYIQWATRMNIEKLLAGKTDYVQTYPDDKDEGKQ